MNLNSEIYGLLRSDRLPHIWCPGCGIGTTLNCFIRAALDAGLDMDKTSVVSGIGCTGRAAGYLNLDSFHTTHGRAIPFATGLKLANPELKVIVFSGDGDLIAIGGNHLIHAARRNIDIMVVCVNNFNYAMTGGQMGPTTPLEARGTTAPYGSWERPFNLPYLAESSGATFVARWTSSHVVHLTRTFGEAFKKKGFVFVEVLAPCPTLYGRRNRLGDAVAMYKDLKESSVVRRGADTKTVGIRFGEKIVIGKFVDKEAPAYLDSANTQLRQILGNGYVPYTGVEAEETPSPA